mmetsp:Transcript_10605/g.45960  ORF Transcript_10605/g.45960 Transcript_10605/m.45960 type:complete len:155 (-) Transcript_10605:166-630(-)
MSEDQIIVIASKPFDGKARTRIAHVASLWDDSKILTNKESRNGTIEGTLQQGTTRRLVHRFETWKTQDDLNFVKSSDITQVIDFNGTKPGNGSEHYEKAKSSFGSAETAACQSMRDAVDQTTEAAVVHALSHGTTKCSTTVAFTEAFQQTAELS